MQIALFRDVMTGSLVDISEKPATYIFTTIKNRGKREKFKKEENVRKTQRGPRQNPIIP
jgi:hypothetical protein